MKVIFNNTKVKFDIKFHLEGILTIGKQYNVIDAQYGTANPYTYLVLCNDDVIRDIPASKFITLEAHRNKILNDIIK
jgi:hypothetical protein